MNEMPRPPVIVISETVFIGDGPGPGAVRKGEVAYQVQHLADPLAEEVLGIFGSDRPAGKTLYQADVVDDVEGRDPVHGLAVKGFQQPFT